MVSSGQGILASPVVTEVVPDLVVLLIYEFLLRPFILWIRDRSPLKRQDASQALERTKALRDAASLPPVTEDELCNVLGINRRKLRRLWKEDKTIRSGYIIEKSESNEGYWTVKRE